MEPYIWWLGLGLDLHIPQQQCISPNFILSLYGFLTYVHPFEKYSVPEFYFILTLLELDQEKKLVKLS